MEVSFEHKSNVERHEAHHRSILWMHFVNVYLGAWLILNPATFIYDNFAMVVNDVVCGTLILIFSFLSFHPARLWAPWAVAFTGMWLTVAPVIFWAPDAHSYNNDTLVGILVMAFALVAPGQPGARLHEQQGPDVPPGWGYNPSSWTQRLPIITLGWLGFFASRYLASFQLGYIDSAWDPFFGKGTENVLNSELSKSWPVSDAGLGAFSYMLDAMMGYIGGENRWRTMPWAVILFGILIIPLGAISITLIILQPLVVGSWCSVCLFTAVAMLIMIPCAFDEVLASVQFLAGSKKEGRPFWRVFWHGDTTYKESIEFVPHDFTRSPRATLWEIFGDLKPPYNLMLCSVLGVWLMFSPSVFGYAGQPAHSDYIAGALVITFSVVAMGEIVRSLRFVNIVLGAWIGIAPYLLHNPDETGLYNAIACGILIIVFSIRRGRIVHSYGGFNKYVV